MTRGSFKTQTRVAGAGPKGNPGPLIAGPSLRSDPGTPAPEAGFETGFAKPRILAVAPQASPQNAFRGFLDNLRILNIKSRPRTGITLYEVVLSLAILLVSLAALGQLFSTGSRAASQSRLQSEATLRCQGKLSEILGGIVPMTAVSGGSFEDGGTDWVWSLDVAEGPHVDLLALEVTVSHLDESGNPDVTSSLRRYTRNPQLFLDAASLEAQFEQEQATQSGGSTP